MPNVRLTNELTSANVLDHVRISVNRNASATESIGEASIALTGLRTLHDGYEINDPAENTLRQHLGYLLSALVVGLKVLFSSKRCLPLPRVPDFLGAGQEWVLRGDSWAAGLLHFNDFQEMPIEPYR